MAEVYMRTLGHLRSSRREGEVAEQRVTPADELTSWLGDDLCANCGHNAPNGKLFCSKECREADACKTSEGLEPVLENEIERRSSPVKSIHHFKGHSDAALTEKFRYPCPPSPSVLAQYSVPLKATSLTSPALTAFQRSLPTNPRGRQSGASNASSDGSHRLHTKKRSSSQSTFSSISESNGSTSAFASSTGTDPSTPSPAYGATEDESSDLDSNELMLPPSVAAASTVILKKSNATRGIPTSSYLFDRSPSSAAPTRRKSEAYGQAIKSPMWYARRPSNTNIQPALLFTPAITATTKVTAIARRNSNSKLAQPDAQATLTRKSAPNGQSPRQKLSSSIFTSPRTFYGGLPMKRGVSDNTATRSPPQVQSAASSAGKTMRAPSPLGSLGSLSSLALQAGCDRCRASTSKSGDQDIFATENGKSSDAMRSSGSSPSLASPRAERISKHKHSHSAAASLFFTQLQSSSDEKNPVALRRGRGRGVATPIPENDDKQGVEENPRSTPQRGRSKARGRSSTSRARSPSPPRAAARRESSTISHRDRSPPSPVSPTSGPISIMNRSRTASRDGFTSNNTARSEKPSPLALLVSRGGRDESPEGDERGRSRGRARDRGRSPVRQWINKHCEPSWPGYGHRDSDLEESRSRSRVRAQRHEAIDEDPGFDDVELELDDDERPDSSGSSQGSFEVGPQLGRGRRVQ